MHLLLLLTFITASTVQTKAKLEPISDELTPRLSLSCCVARAVDHFLKPDRVISMSIATMAGGAQVATVPLDTTLLTYLFGYYKWTVITRKVVLKTRYDAYLKRIECYIMHIRDFAEVAHSLEVLKEDIAWNPNAKFFIVTAAELRDESRGIEKTIGQLWKNKIVNVVMLFPSGGNGSSYNVYTWYPFGDGRCGDDFHAELIDVCEYGSFDRSRWFNQKIPKDLGNCSVKVRTSITPPFVISKSKGGGLDGFEVRLLSEVSEMTNLFFAYSLSDQPNFYGEIFENGTATGSYLDLKNEEVDMIVGYVVPGVETQFIFDVTPSYFQEQTSNWMQIESVANVHIIGLCLVIIVLITLVVRVLGRFENETVAAYKSLIGISYDLVEVLFGLPIHSPPASNKIRFLLMLWIIFCLHLKTSFVSNLVTNLTNQDYDDEIKNVDDIVNSRLDILLYPLCKIYIDQNRIGRSEDVSICDDVTACLGQRNSATCSPRLHVNYLLARRPRSEVRVFCFEESLITFPIQMLMCKGFLFKERIEILVSKLNAAGLVHRLQRDILLGATLRGDGPQLADTDVPLSVKHLSAVFLVFGIGVALSLTTFVLENLIAHLGGYPCARD